MRVVAIDGPAASGKSTSARHVAQQLGFMHLDTGAMYRAVTLTCLEHGLPPEESNQLNSLLDSLQIKFQPRKNRGQKMFLDGRDVTEAIRGPEVSRHVSAYSALPMVRKRLVDWQREIGSQHDVVCEGRDIGTRVFPTARYKFYLVADLKTRAQRRRDELRSRGFSPDLKSIIRELSVRDREDSTRKHSPLQKAQDAIVVDTTRLTIEEQVKIIVSAVRKRDEQDSHISPNKENLIQHG